MKIYRLRLRLRLRSKLPTPADSDSAALVLCVDEFVCFFLCQELCVLYCGWDHEFYGLSVPLGLRRVAKTHVVLDMLGKLLTAMDVNYAVGSSLYGYEFIFPTDIFRGV